MRSYSRDHVYTLPMVNPCRLYYYGLSGGITSLYGLTSSFVNLIIVQSYPASIQNSYTIKWTPKSRCHFPISICMENFCGSNCAPTKIRSHAHMAFPQHRIGVALWLCPLGWSNMVVQGYGLVILVIRRWDPWILHSGGKKIEDTMTREGETSLDFRPPIRVNKLRGYERQDQSARLAF